MPNTTVDFTIANQLVQEVLNTATQTAGVFNDDANGRPRWLLANIQNNIVAVDFEVAKTICETFGHPRRNYYRTSAAVVNQGPLPDDAIGPVDNIVITYSDGTSRVSTPETTDWIDIFNAATNSVFGGALYCDGYAQQIGNRVQFTGVSAVCNYFTVSIGSAAVNGLKSPAEYLYTVVKGAAVMELLKESEYLEPAQILNKDYQGMLQAIRGLGVTVAPAESAQMAGA